MHSWYIPAFDLFFSSVSFEMGEKIAKASVQSFVSFYINHEGFREFILQLHKLGFKAPMNHEYTIKQLLTHKINVAKFKSKVIKLPVEFENSNSYSPTEMKIAI